MTIWKLCFGAALSFWMPPNPMWVYSSPINKDSGVIFHNCLPGNFRKGLGPEYVPNINMNLIGKHIYILQGNTPNIFCIQVLFSILSWFYLDFIQILSRIYPDFFKTHYLDFVQSLSRFYHNFWKYLDKIRKSVFSDFILILSRFF